MNFLQEFNANEIFHRVADLLQLPITLVVGALSDARDAFHSPNQTPSNTTSSPENEGSGADQPLEPTTELAPTTSTFLEYNPINVRVKIPLAADSLDLRESDIEKRVSNYLRSSDSPFDLTANVVRVTKYRNRPSVVLKLHTADDEWTLRQKINLTRQALPNLFSENEPQERALE
ncbi:Oidioi.mRNA.OKI2018_I69.chr2.g7728.t1.cds [Oikopleura dioica]|uniref:Oidioi.mRNA.OKI2018_I69.chr2.g7728.t1.cds n=1 Tax=Oikopleura dioica TaxID=34765 RepID=A0ABN7TDI4_OIKDI|nr:Oidioi.mRNA.OKI2018_I69.chr2.g7728.t1.cds [Oikopleura dioica]